jgi:hypothetical protein
MRTSRLRPILCLASLFVCATIAVARAENWVSSGDACLDIDSIRWVNDTKIGEALISYRVSTCEHGHPDVQTYLLGVKRRECPAIIQGATSFASFMYMPKESNWRFDVNGHLKGAAFRGLALVACRKKGAPDGLVVFENDLSKGAATVFVDGSQVCILDSESFLSSSCDVDLRRFGDDPQRRHAVRIIAGRREVNDTVSLSDCHWNWQGTKVFEVRDDRVHFDCM